MCERDSSDDILRGNELSRRQFGALALGATLAAMMPAVAAPNPMLTIHHQNGKLQFEIDRAVYAIEDGKLSLSIECAKNAAHEALDGPVFSFLRCPLPDALMAGSELAIEGRQGDRDSFDEPSTHWYSGRHADPWNARLRVIALHGDRLEAEITFDCEDPIYYGPRAKPVRVECRPSFTRVNGADVRQLM